MLFTLSHQVGTELEWSVYFTRFTIIFWWLIIPIIYLWCYFFIREIRRGRDVVVLFPALSVFRPYKYFFHNMAFVFVVGIFAFNSLFFIYGVIDVHILKLNDLYKWIWFLPKDLKENVDSRNEKNFLWTVIFPGYILNSICNFNYAYHNLYRTDSYFSVLFKEFIVKSSQGRFLMNLKYTRPNIYKKIDHYFLQLSEIESRHRTKKKSRFDP